MYLSHVVDTAIYHDAWLDISSSCERDKELRSKANRLRRQLADLEREAIARGLMDGSSSLSAAMISSLESSSSSWTYSLFLGSSQINQVIYIRFLFKFFGWCTPSLSLCIFGCPTILFDIATLNFE